MGYGLVKSSWLRSITNYIILYYDIRVSLMEYTSKWLLKNREMDQLIQWIRE